MQLVNKARPYTPLSMSLKPLHPFCHTCGWRKGGIDSWDGRRCKCGSSEPVISADAEFEESTGFFVNGRPTKSIDPEQGIAWFNGLTEAARANWLSVANSATPADAWKAYKRSQAKS